jgi:hypothetical protein
MLGTKITGLPPASGLFLGDLLAKVDTATDTTQKVTSELTGRVAM